MKYFINPSFLVLAIIFNTCAIAQEKSADVKGKTISSKSYFKSDISYLSNAVYYGRQDSSIIPYISTTLGYYHKSGIYISGTLAYFASTDDSRIDAVSLQGGYNFNISNQISGSAYASKYFYSSSSYAVKSEIQEGLGGSISYNPDIIQVSGGLDFLFSNKVDFSINAAVAHAFYIGPENKQFTITPTVTSFLGTLNFYTSYYKNRKFNTGGTKGRGKKKSSGNGNNTVGVVQVQTNNKFTVLDYEISLPINYDRKKWGLFFIPTYAIPVHPITFTLPNNTKFNIENLNNVFFAELGGYLKF